MAETTLPMDPIVCEQRIYDHRGGPLSSVVRYNRDGVGREVLREMRWPDGTVYSRVVTTRDPMGRPLVEREEVTLDRAKGLEPMRTKTWTWTAPTSATWVDVVTSTGDLVERAQVVWGVHGIEREETVPVHSWERPFVSMWSYDHQGRLIGWTSGFEGSPGGRVTVQFGAENRRTYTYEDLSTGEVTLVKTLVPPTAERTGWLESRWPNGEPGLWAELHACGDHPNEP